MKPRTVAFTTTAALLVAACHSYRPLPHPATAVGKTVKVEFSVPRSLVAVRGAGGDSVFSAVSAFRGQVVAAAGDTMQVVLTRITDSALDHPVPPGMTVSVISEPSVAVDVLEIDSGKTAAFAGGTIVIVSIVALVALIAALAAAGTP